MQGLVFCAMAGFLFMLLAVTSYPFQPRDSLLWFNWVVILGTAVMAVVAFVQVGRDRILSLISGTTPGRIDWNREFITRILIYGLVPVLTLLGARFPEALRSVLSALSRTAP